MRLARLLGRRRAKRRAELGYWRERAAIEGELGAGHFEHLFTQHFGLTRDFYAGKAMLDVGCGPRGSLEWAHIAGTRLGLDPLADEYRKLRAGEHAMTYVTGRAERMPFYDASFDVVSSFNSLDHVEDLDAVIAEIKRVLRPGGQLLLLLELRPEPTITEPYALGPEVMERFEPELELVASERLEHADPTLYGSLLAAVPWDDSRAEPRLSALSARFVRR